ncbi:MAG: SOS response-associated peptidase family protein, partial [Steroidobacteraceae bacterium]|nr:SOS response-associated peptidase family protein [Steroidobacteraceae bacterium]
ESFFENVERDGKNVVLHFNPKPAGTMIIACLYSEWRDANDGSPLLSFAAITDEPPAEVAAAGHDRMIINLKPEHLNAWLQPKGKSVEELQRVLGDRQAPYYEHEVMAA